MGEGGRIRKTKQKLPRSHTQPHGRNIINVERNLRENSVMDVEGGKSPMPRASKRLEMERTIPRHGLRWKQYEIISKSHFQ